MSDEETIGETKYDVSTVGGSSAPPPNPPSSGGQVSSSAYSSVGTNKHLQGQIDEIKNWMIGVVIAVFIAFCGVVYDMSKDKDVIINYGNLADRNMERYGDLNKAMYELRIQLNKKEQEEREKENSKLMRQNECLLKANQLGKAECLFQ